MNLHAAPIQRFGADGQEKLPPLRAAIEGGAAGAERPPRAAAAPRCRGSRRRACGQGLAAMAEGVSPAPRRGQGNASFPVSARALSALSLPSCRRILPLLPSFASGRPYRTGLRGPSQPRARKLCALDKSAAALPRSEEHTSELQYLMRISYSA